MGLFFNRKKSNRETVLVDTASDVEIEAIKRETHKKIQTAAQATESLNSLLRANGITLNISIATGGHHRANH
jgi:hypothetical protein